MNLPVAILAGGLATRLHPITEKIAKAVVVVAGKPFCVHQLELLRRNGLTDVVFCIGYKGDQIQAALGDGTHFGMRVRYSIDGAPLLGTGGALRRALPLLGQAFLVLYGDSYLDCDYAAVMNAFESGGKLGLMTVYRNDDLWDRSNVLFRNGRIERYDKERRTPDMRHIDYGLGALRAEAMAAYPPDSKFDLAEVYSSLLEADQLAGFEVAQRFYEIGSLNGLRETEVYLQTKQTR